MKFSEYNAVSGDIVRTISCSERDAQNMVSPGGALIAGEFDPERYFVRDGTALEREAMPQILVDRTAAGVQLRGVPAGVVIEIEGLCYTCDGSRVDLDLVHPGPYTLRFYGTGYLAQELIVE